MEIKAVFHSDGGNDVWLFGTVQIESDIVKREVTLDGGGPLEILVSAFNHIGFPVRTTHDYTTKSANPPQEKKVLRIPYKQLDSRGDTQYEGDVYLEIPKKYYPLLILSFS